MGVLLDLGAQRARAPRVPLGAVEESTFGGRCNLLRLLAAATTDPLAERLVRDIIAELEDRLRADSKRASEP
jgi:hypothetical protein